MRFQGTSLPWCSSLLRRQKLRIPRLSARCSSTYGFHLNHQQDYFPARALSPANGFWLFQKGSSLASFSRKQWIDAVYLRDRCSCTRCVNSKTHQKTFGTSEIPLDISIERIDTEGQEWIVHWKGDVHSEPHLTYFDPADLHNARLQAEQIMNPGKSLLWSMETMQQVKAKRVNVSTFDDYMRDEATFSRILEALRDYGLVFITDVPASEQSVERLGERIGPLRHTFYGRTWDVKDKPDAENVAYTSTDLELHMDLLYMKQPPGLQLLHSIHASGTGGVSTFSDSFRAAELLFHEPSTRFAFDVLASYPVSYHYRHPGSAFFDTKPTFEVDTLYDEVRRDLEDTTASMPTLKNVNWSPPFQAPFVADAHRAGSAHRLRQYHQAAQAFSHLINHDSLQFRHLLQPGECVMFNNRRVLHGRTSFTSGPEERFLKGAYVDTDDFQSQLRQRGLNKN